MVQKKTKSKQKIKSIMFTAILTIVVIAVFAYLIMNDEFIPGKENKNLVAIVNEGEITQAELDTEYAKLPEQYKALISKEDLLEQLIDKKLLLQEAENKGITVSDAEIRQQLDAVKQQFPTEEVFMQILKQQNLTLNDVQIQLKEQLLMNTLLNQTVLSGIDISEKEISDYYEENKQQFIAQSGQIRAAHILVNSEEKAEEIMSLLDKGADFQEIASEESQDPSATASKGDLGFFSKGSMVKEFEDAAFSLKVDEISKPVETQFGYHIIKRLPNVIPLSEARESISLALSGSVQSGAIQNFLSELRDKADIQKGEDLIKEEDLTLPTTSVEEPGLTSIETKNEFTETTDEICTEDGQPVLRLYTSSKCQKCVDVKPALDAALADYDMVPKEVDLTEALKKGSMPKKELDILKKYNPKGAVPTYVFGCRYVRIGNAFEELDLIKEENAFREILEELI